MAKIVAVSDLHGNLPTIPECDILLIGGDICPYTQTNLQAQWLRVAFKEWLDKVPAKDVVGVAGNHDFIFENHPDLVPKELRWHYLQDESINLHGLNIYGTPWQPRFYDWAFNADEPELEKHFGKIPEGTDILVCHGPPHGYGDFAPKRYWDDDTKWPGGEHCGSPALRDRIFKIKPKLVIFGHIHPGRGVYYHEDIIMANVTIVDQRYEPIHDPMSFDIT